MIMKIEGYKCNVTHISEFARGPGGRCAFCAGDPCNEHPEQGEATAMKQYAADHPQFETCPCCEGRAT